MTKLTLYGDHGTSEKFKNKNKKYYPIQKGTYGHPILGGSSYELKTLGKCLNTI